MPVVRRHDGSDSGYLSGEEVLETQVSGKKVLPIGEDGLLQGVCPVCQDDIDCNEQHCVSLYCEGNVPPGGHKVVKVCTMDDVKRLIASEAPETPLQLECGHKLHVECLKGHVKAGANACPLCNRLIAPHSKRTRVPRAEDYYGDVAAAYAQQDVDMQSLMTDADVAVAQRRIDQLMMSDSQSDRDRATELQRGLEAVRTNMASLNEASLALPEYASNSHIGMIYTQYEVCTKFCPRELFGSYPGFDTDESNRVIFNLLFRRYQYVLRQPVGIHEMLRRLEQLSPAIYSSLVQRRMWEWVRSNNYLANAWVRNASRVVSQIGGFVNDDDYSSSSYQSYSRDRELMGPLEASRFANLKHVEPLMVQFMQQMRWSPNRTMILPSGDSGWNSVPADLVTKGGLNGDVVELELPGTMFMIDSDMFQATDYHGWMEEIYTYNRQQRGGGTPSVRIPDVKRHRTAKQRTKVIHGAVAERGICAPIAMSLFFLAVVVAALPRL